MLKQVKNLKHKWAYFSVLILFFVSIVYIFSSSNTTPSIPTVVSPTPITSSESLILVSTEPDPGIYETIWTTTAIVFNFNQPIDPNSLKYTVTPKIDLVSSLGDNPNILILRPSTEWKFDVPYRLSIDSLNSASGNPLASRVYFEYKITNPTDIISQ